MMQYEDRSLKLQILQNINLCSIIHKTYKLNILNKLLNQNKDLAPQGSPEWLADRIYNIGGSEMATITGDNCFSSIDQLVSQKVGFTHFSGNIATKWGKLFECVTKQLTEIIFDIDDGIKETGSLDGAVPNQRYSPDGLAVIKFKCEEVICDKNIETEEYCIVLFEFKSPLYSIPSGSIPKYYIPQVKTGLCSIPITDFALFISNMFRKCSFDELGASMDYDKDFHNRDCKIKPKVSKSTKNPKNPKNNPTTKKTTKPTNKIDITSPLAFGLILFYQTEIQYTKFYEKYKHLITYTEYNYDSDSDDEAHMLADYIAKKNPNKNHNGNPHEINNQSKNVFDLINDESVPKFKLTYAENDVLCKYIYETYNKKTKSKDFGKSYYRDFNDILQLYEDGLLSVEYCKPHILEEYNKNAFLSAQGKTCGSNIYTEVINGYSARINSRISESGHPIIGYLPWKLFKSDIIYESRDSTYLNAYESKIQDTINIIQKINKADTQEDKIELFKHYYPKSKVLKNAGLDNDHIMEFLPHNM
jgi:hypothetical protein